MKWENRNLLETLHAIEIENKIKHVCKEYDVLLPEKIVINKRLRATDGCHKSFALYTEIHLAYNHYVEFGFDSLIKVLMHEIAHHIRYMKYEDISHGEEFKKLCKKLNGCLNETHAVGKYKNMSYRGIQTPFKWYYICTKCGSNFYTKKRLNDEKRKCFHCGNSLDNFTIIDLRSKKNVKS